MPTICSRLSLLNSVSSGASSWHGTHHDAQTLTTLTLPLNTAGSSPGTCEPSWTRPGSGGNAVCGAGRPSRAEGIRAGSPLPRRNQKIAASPTNAISGSVVSQDLADRSGDRSGGEVLEVEGSLILCQPRCVPSAERRRQPQAH